MKLLINILIALLIFPVLASADSDMLVYMLSSDVVKAELAGKDIKTIEFNKVNVGTTWTFTANIVASEAGWGQNGPSTHPCFTIVEVVSIGGVAGTETSEPTAETICAMNSRGF